MSKDDLGDRMKGYEHTYTSARIRVDNVLIARIDGKNFSRYTQGYDKPYDRILSAAFDYTAEMLMQELKPKFVYTQSDEITMAFLPGENATEHMFGGKVSKLNSVFASMATGFFNRAFTKMNTAFFDCRVFGVPTKAEASNALYWRILDARRNAVSSAYRWTHGHKKMQNKSCKEMEAELDMDQYPERFTHGYLRVRSEAGSNLVSPKKILECGFGSRMAALDMYEEEEA